MDAVEARVQEIREFVFDIHKTRKIRCPAGSMRYPTRENQGRGLFTEKPSAPFRQSREAVYFLTTYSPQQ